MARVVGTQNRSEFILDPVQVLRRGQDLDRLSTSLLPPRPRGITRAQHRVFNELDDQRQLEQARLVNAVATLTVKPGQ